MRIQLPLETSMAILDWLRIWETFEQLRRQLWDSQLTALFQHSLHAWRRDVSIGPFEIARAHDGQATVNSPLETVPIADVAGPALTNITGFHQFKIGYLDPAVLAFLQRVLLPIPRTFHLEIPAHPWECEPIVRAFTHLWPLFQDSTVAITANCYIFEALHQRLPLFIRNTKLLSIEGSPFNATYLPLLVQWLFTLRQDGQPRLLRCACFVGDSSTAQLLLDRIKQNFLHQDRQPALFFVHLTTLPNSTRPFINENPRVGEQLILRTQISDEQQYFVIANIPAGAASEWPKIHEQSHCGHFVLPGDMSFNI